MILHPAEDVVVHVAEEVYFGLHPPVVFRVGQGRVFVKQTAVPTAHLVVGDHVPVLNVLFFEHEGGFVEEVFVDPRGYGPVRFGNNFVVAFSLCFHLRPSLEYF